jgi:UDP-N-acetylmuramoyl-L-alanyl-D-glutamate--2,6-diaminopimelate ligase
LKLSQLLSIFPRASVGSTPSAEVTPDTEVSSVTTDSREAKPGAVFVAVRGSSADGHRFLPEVARLGAAAVVVEDAGAVPSGFTGAVVTVKDTRVALAELARRYYGDPARDLFCVGVTGTNGKTTVTYMVEAVLNRAGRPTGVLGTIDHHLGPRKWESRLTTPDALTLQRRLRQFVDAGAKAAAFEVSSHALAQARADGLPFAVGVFTNFTRDHLDYHHSMENYFAAKERLFAELLRRPGAVAVLNGDDPAVRRVRVRDGVTTWWYGAGGGDFVYRIVREDLSGSLFHLSTPRGSVEVSLPCPGRHNIANATAAIAVGLAAGVALAAAAAALGGFFGAPGRLEKVDNGRGLFIFVDYAHTDDALRTVLRALVEARRAARADGARLITVFGCGGDRDRGKRPMMARAACELSDVVVITSDNPRGEDPLAIIAEIEKGVPPDWRGRKLVEPDRRRALAAALQTAREGDVILVAGKGHEDDQIIGDRRLSFSDRQVITELLQE